MNIGALDKRLTIKQRVLTMDSATGIDAYTWPTTLAEVWGNIQDVMPSRDETLRQGAAVVSPIRARVRIRWRDDVDTTMRIETPHPTPRTFQIIGGPAEIGGRKQYLEFMCEEVVSG